MLFDSIRYNLAYTLVFRMLIITRIFLEKVPAHIQYDHFIEISKPPSKDFINLVLKYGGKIKNCAPERVMPSATNKKVNESSDKHVKSAIPHVENQPTHSDHKNGAEKHKKHKKREYKRFLVGKNFS